MSVIVPISSALPLKADVAAVGRESPKLTLRRHMPLSAPRHSLATTIRLFDRIARVLPGRKTVGSSSVAASNRAFRTHALAVRPCRTGKFGPGQVGPFEKGIGEIGIAQVGAEQAGLAQIHTDHGGVA